MQVDIYVREKSGKREIRIPLLPEEITFQSGDTMGVTYDIMGLGEVVIPSGTELGSWSWKSEFPGFFRENDPMIRGTWYQPHEYDSILNDWKKNGTELNLLVTGYPINNDVYIAEYHGGASGAFGDISYEIKFMEARSIVVTTSKEEQAEATPDRPATTSSTYVIKSGDTLWGIAKKFYGSGAKWGTIYNANKEIIEKTAKKYGRKSSDNGHWIYPGVTLTIPNVSGSDQPSSATTGSNPSTTTPTSTADKSTQAVAEAYTSKRNSTIDAKVLQINSAKKPLIIKVEATK